MKQLTSHGWAKVLWSKLFYGHEDDETEDEIKKEPKHHEQSPSRIATASIMIQTLNHVPKVITFLRTLLSYWENTQIL